MAREVLGVVGAGVGFAVGGATGAQIGYAIGSTIGTLIDPPYIDGPALGDAGLQTSRDGVPIPIGWGITHVVGNIIQMNPIVYSTKKSGDKKGGVKENIAKRTFAIGICRSFAGPISGILRCWENNKLIYDVRDGSTFPSADNTAFEAATTIYLGTETQLPDSELESHTGVGSTPAYRALAYIVFNNKDLTSFGSSIPSYRFEIYAGDSALLPRQADVLAWWELEEAGGFRPVFLDEVSSYQLKGINDIDKIAGVIGEGLDLKITNNEYVETIDVPTQYALAIEDRNWSCAIWHTTKPAIVPDGYVISAWNANPASTTTGERQWRVKTNAAGNGFEFRITEDICPDDGVVEISTGDIGLDTETRYHIVVTHDPVGNEMTMTINAGTRLTATIHGGAVKVYDLLCQHQPNTAQVIQLGASEGSILGTENNCEADMPSFWGITLSSSQVQRLYNDGDGIQFSDLPL